MSSPQNLKELYLEELQDLWSANDQMARIVTDMAGKVGDDNLKDKLEKSVSGIEKHIQVLKDLIEDAGGELKKEHCKGMEGLVKEARKHAVEADGPADVIDVAAIAQFQRMSHYGLAGFGTAAAFAQALGLTEAVSRLDAATANIYDSDQYMTELAERSENLEAKAG